MTFITENGKELIGIHGYKGLSEKNSSTCGKKFQFEQGKVFKENCEPRFKHKGFHFCLYLEDVKKFVPGCAKIVEVIALGEVEGNGTEYCTNEIYIGKTVQI